MPIKGLTEQRRLPRLGKIHLGEKRISKNTQREYPVATTYFVCPPEIQAIYGDKPTRLDIIIPVEDDELWCPQYLKQYSVTRGLVCRGDGVTCRRMVDKATGAVASRETKGSVHWIEGGECKGRDCADYQAKRCQEVMNLQVLLPKAPGIGAWQIDTGSINSIRNINNEATMIRAACGRVSWIPLTLTLEPTEVTNPDDGKKKTVYCMHLRQDKGLEELLLAAGRPKTQLFIAAPVEDEAPADKLLNAGSPENIDELEAKVGDDIGELWGDGVRQAKPAPLPVSATTAKPLPPVPAPAPVANAQAAFETIESASEPQEINTEFELKSWLGKHNITAQQAQANLNLAWAKIISEPNASANELRRKLNIKD